MNYHMDRLYSSAKVMASHYKETGPFQRMPDQKTILDKVRDATDQAEKASDADQFRIRILVSDKGAITVTASPEPVRTNPDPLRVILDNQPVSSNELFLRHKTTFRPMYDAARKRHDASLTDLAKPFDVILFNEKDQITETTISNFAVQLPGDQGKLTWFTPPVECGKLKQPYLYRYTS